jgi:hypothetical protein
MGGSAGICGGECVLREAAAASAECRALYVVRCAEPSRERGKSSRVKHTFFRKVTDSTGTHLGTTSVPIIWRY